MINQVGVGNWYSCCFTFYLFHWNFGYFIYPSLLSTGVGSQESEHRSWLIQALFEYALGMKLSSDYQTGRISLSALHQSSGNALFWILTDSFFLLFQH